MKLQCPVPVIDGERILLAHGGGGQKSWDLIDKIFLPAFGDSALTERVDAAVLPGADRVVLTTDAFVVRPLFFPGGDIGRLAVFGAANDLSMAGARPVYLTVAFILEEGLPLETLRRVVASMAAAAKEVGIRIVAGDTKVVGRGQADGLYIASSGVGFLQTAQSPSPARVKPGDVVLLSGDLGRHGVAVMAAREGLDFETVVESDGANLWPAVEALLASGVQVHALRDLTRGGLTSAVNEIARSSGTSVRLVESAIPVSPPVRAACEVLGLDVLAVANEGRFVAFVPEKEAERALASLRPWTPEARIVGQVLAGPPGRVTITPPLGGERLLDMLSGELLPRIC
ncbi:MAG: hydrogenase expression/formation protein HypE [Elusimicrobia bacterium]|nr:hydrogenase expression/formation protein HypE [Elusimicrobiota bacterium]